MGWLTTYWVWLAALCAAFAVLERWRPRRAEQGFFRPGLATDLAYMVFNGHFLGVLLAYVTEPTAAALDHALGGVGIAVHARVAGGWPWGAQLTVAFVVIDLMQWSVHNLLHRVPALWSLHRVHHSITTMDFWGSMRFHFGEAVVYKALLYLPLALLGFDGSALFALAVISTAIGHWNHANLRVELGPLRYVLNGPQMHAWHHAHPREGHTNVNFAINLALWDWLFRTAYLPPDGAPPATLGFEGIEAFPRDPLRQALWPVTHARAGSSN